MSIWVGIIAFISEYLDSGLGMGYGTALAPILIIMGFSPLKVVPAILISQLVTDIATCVFHQKYRNVDFRIKSQDFKVSAILGLVSSLGVIISATMALRIPKWLLTLYIGVLVLAMGLLIIFYARKPLKISWRKIVGISFLAAFNKGISGGGYGPLVMGGQILAGINTKSAVGITALAEAWTCFVGFMVFLILGKDIDWQLIGLLLASALPAVPFAALTVKKIDPGNLKRLVGILITLLGIFTLLKISQGS